jgi:two-component system CheB/CheR fusion protein
MEARDSARDFENLLDYLKQNRGFDFTGYKRASLARRIEKRMQAVEIEGYGNYIDYLEVHPEEFTQLFNFILINVTSFFRDLPAWEYLAKEIIPRMVGGKSGRPIRVWSAACSSGEEAYSLAILLAEALGPEAFRERVKIYATDMDEEALATARQAAYAAREVSAVPSHLLEKYFEVAGGRYIFDKELRRSVIFGRHDLIQDAPISRVQLLVCRNTLMYFNAETQARVLARFHFALDESGFLFLGKAEMLLTQSNVFAPVEMKRRIFAKVPRGSVRDRLLLMAQAGGVEPLNQIVNHVRLRENALDANPLAQVALDVNNCLALANEQARQMLGLTPRDLGRPLVELDLAERPVALGSHLEAVKRERQPVTLNEVSWQNSGDSIGFLDVELVPLLDTGTALHPGNNLVGVSITFKDVTAYCKLREELQHANQELETAYEELQSTNEELETTNEELQSTVEELETTNEELQSTNEELETMNEELQSTNEELQTMNEELRQRGEELNEVNAFLESILGSLRGGVVVIDQEMQIQIWNHRSEDLWGLRADEVQGKHLLNLDIGLPVDELRQPIRACLSGEAEYQEVTLDALNRRGRSIRCRVTCTPLVGTISKVRGAILAMEEV